MFRDSTKFASRGQDSTLKLWDIRQQKEPFLTWEDLECSVEKLQCCFSPNDKVIVTGTEAVKGKQMAKLTAFNTITGEQVCNQNICNDAVVTVEWHSQLNQIFLGLRNSSIISFYDPNQSKNGILNCLTRQEKRRPIEGRGYFTP